jgi:hypothetical protein
MSISRHKWRDAPAPALQRHRVLSRNIPNFQEDSNLSAAGKKLAQGLQNHNREQQCALSPSSDGTELPQVAASRYESLENTGKG